MTSATALHARATPAPAAGTPVLSVLDCPVPVDFEAARGGASRRSYAPR